MTTMALQYFILVIFFFIESSVFNQIMKTKFFKLILLLTIDTLSCTDYQILPSIKCSSTKPDVIRFSVCSNDKKTITIQAESFKSIEKIYVGILIFWTIFNRF